MTKIRSHTNSTEHAFTLIELLVVIIIIAILIGLLFPAFRGVQDQAKRAQAKNDVSQIVTAVNAYYTEYGKYPIATDDSTIPNNAALMNVLRAIDTTNNPRQIVFISPPNVKDTSSPRNGIGSDGQYYDPWGPVVGKAGSGIYQIKIDGNYDNQLANPYTQDSGAGPASLNIGVIAWSLGSDGQLGTAGDGRYKTAATPPVQCDDAISWQ